MGVRRRQFAAIACAAALLCSAVNAGGQTSTDQAEPSASASSAAGSAGDRDLPAFQERMLQFEGEPLRFGWRPLTVSAPPADASLEPLSALDTSWLLHRHLARGEIVEAALLSNAPRRRHAELARFRQAVGDAGFREVFAQYFAEGNRPIAEAAIGPYRLLIWNLETEGRFAGEYFVEVEGRVLIDDGPGETRFKLRRVLESLRAGQLPGMPVAATPANPQPRKDQTP